MAVDYSQTTEDHQSFLVLIKHTGKQLPWKHFGHCWDRIRQLDYIAIPGQKREMFIRYKRVYPKELNEWGDFQGHRKALGLICFGKCSTEKEFDDLFELYKREKSEYADTLFNSRLVVFGMNADGSPLTEEQRQELEDLSPPMTMIIDDKQIDKVACDSGTSGEKEGDKNSNGQVLRDFVDPLRSSVPVPVTLTEALVDSPKVVKKETVQRTHSNSLNKDTPGSEVVFYQNMDKSDGLEESVKEFVTSLFFVLEGKRLDRSFERADRQTLLCAPFEKKDYVGIDPDSRSYKKKCQGRLRKHLADLCLQAGTPGEAMLHYSTAIDILKPVNDWLWMAACYEGLCAASVISTLSRQPAAAAALRRNQSFSVKRGVAGQDKQRTGGTLVHTGSYANGLQDLPAETTNRSCLDPDDIIEKYKEALMLYSKYKNAAMVEMEASLKACRVMITQKKYLQASDFLQNVVYINYTISEEDRIQRYATLSSLYSQIGFKRKASFFKRVAAMQCVASTNPKPNWHLCHQLLVQTLDGYCIRLDPKECATGPKLGWTILQTRVLHEMIYSARRMGNIPLAVRYTTLMLYALLDQLSPTERREVVSSLESFTSQREGMNNPLALESGVILPAVPLLNIPLVKSFKLMPLHPHLEPKPLKAKDHTNNGVFIFTPINFGVEDNTIKTDVDFCWVEGDVCEVQLQAVNPMPDELKIAHMGLLTEGDVGVETFLCSPSIPPEAGQYLVKIMTRPVSPGDLTILGYSTKLFGVRSNCRLIDLPAIPQTHFKVKVVPGLPQIQLSTSLPKSASFLSFGEDLNVVTSGAATMYCGQSSECLVTLQNNGKLAADWVKVGLECGKEARGCVEEVFQWNTENIDSQLPLQVSCLLCFNVALYATGDFLPQKQCAMKNSHDIGDSGVANEGKCVEAIMKLEYSGGAGLKEGYCRCCSVAFSIDILPSVVFHKWDVMNSESSEHCYLLFDIQNVSGHELELLYASQCTYLKHEQIRRVTLQIERCQPMTAGTDSPLSFSQHLANFVDIRWVMPSVKVGGKVSIEHLTWSPEQQQLVYTSPVSWEIHLNGQVLSPLHIGSLEYRIGQLVQLDVELNIKSDTPEVDGSIGVLSLCCCQHCDNGSVQYDVSDQVMSLGAESLVVPKISPDLSVSHTCSYVFTCCGFYRFEIMMQVRGQSDVEGQSELKNVRNFNSESSSVQWKCSSVIEINIVG